MDSDMPDRDAAPAAAEGADARLLEMLADQVMYAKQDRGIAIMLRISEAERLLSMAARPAPAAAPRAADIPPDVLDALERCEHFFCVPAGPGQDILRGEAWAATYAVLNRIRAAALEAARGEG